MKKLYSFIATLLAISMIFTMFSAVPVVSAEEALDVWNGEAATEFAGGDGTETNPFLIENGDQLAKAVIDKGLNNGAAAYYMITNDIYLNEDYENYKNWGTKAPQNNWGITYSSSAFSGVLDGGYHTVYGMYYSKGGSYAGLVAYLSGTGATIRNLIISNSYVENTAGNTTAVFAGRIDNGTIANCIAHDCYITNSDNHTMAGIAAWSNTSTTKISNCGAYDLKFSEGATIVGGILSKSNTGNATISSCYSGGTYIFGNTSNIACSNSYTDIDAAWKNGVSEILDGSMQGANALTAMANLATGIWKATDSYPTLIGNGVKGETWRGTKAAWFAGGKGTASHPFLIETGEQLYKAIADKGMYAGVGAYYLITADIYLNSDYENYADWATTAPANNWGVTYSDSSFAGYLDGGLHTVYGMYFNATASRAGLISYLSGDNATLSNLIVTNSYVYNSGDGTAVLVGRLDNGTVTNCIVHDSMVANGSNSVMGGIVGYAGSSSTSTINNCGAYSLTFGAEATVVGGILGKSTWPTYVNGCYSGGTYIFGDTNSIGCTSSHTDTSGSGKSGVTNWSSTPEKMQGEGAVANMGLSTIIWKDTEGYPTFAQNNGVKGETWTGAMAYRFAGGSGTEADPYIIETAEQLYKAVSELGKKSDGTAAYYLITADIYLNSGYENYADWATTAPANDWVKAQSAQNFIGHLDGGLYTVYGMYLNKNTWGSNAGLISSLSDGATVSNLIIANSYVYNHGTRAGGVVGRLYEGTVSNCIVHDSLLCHSSGGSVVGGICGSSENANAKINNCSTYNLTINGSTNIGGILGISYTSNASVSTCYSVDYYPFGDVNNIWADYNYTNIEGTKGGVITIDKTAMIGTAAIDGMKYLDFINIWQTVENGYPTLRKASDNNLSQQITASYTVSDNGKAGVKFSSKVVMPAINPTYDDNIVITVDGVKKTVSEVGFIISRAGIDVTDISEIENNPLTGYKAVGYKNGGENAEIVIGGGYIIVSAIVSGTADYTAKSYILFVDGTAVIGDTYSTAPSTESTTVDGVKVNDTYTKGDANFDGAINVIDIVRIKKYSALGDSFIGKTVLTDIIDTDSDNDFDATDIAKLRRTLLEGTAETPASTMSLVFEDNFNTPTVDSSKWDFNDYMAGYADMPTATTSDVQSIVSDENGNSYLHLTAYKTEDGNYKTVKSITTGNKLTFINGYVEIRAKVPTVLGAWPSFWLKSNTGNANLGWSSDVAYNTEVDVFEVMGSNSAISELHKWKYDAESDTTTDIRYGSYADRNSYAITDNDWHTYGMLWTENTITMYVDGVAIQTYDLNTDYEGANGLGMDGFKNQPLCITINNHLFTPEYQKTQTNGWTDDKVVGDDFTESVYDIDYVRLYQDETGILYKAN